MTAFNAVRCRVKPGREQDFLDAHAKVQRNWAGPLHANIIKTGEHTYCIIAEWADMDSLANARPNMIATLDTFRDTLEDLGGGLSRLRACGAFAEVERGAFEDMKKEAAREIVHPNR